MADLFDTLICFCDENAVPAMIASNFLHAKELIIITERKNVQQRIINQLVADERELKVLPMTPEDYLKICRTWDNKALLVNGCESIWDYRLLSRAVLCGVPLYFADSSEGQLRSLSDENIKTISREPLELDVQEIIELAGCSIEETSDEAMDSSEITKLLNYIVQDKRRWDRIRHQLKNNFSVEGEWITIGSRQPIRLEYNTSLRDFLAFLENERLIQEKHIEQRSVTICIPNPAVRRFIEVTGMWLEALTYRTLRSLPYIDDAMASVRFLWDECPDYLVNEVDVLATKDSRLVVVSCKDVSGISTDMLNELSLYAEKLGGETAIKVLVTSRPVSSLHLEERAKAMGIEIICFNGDPKAFRQRFDGILSNI